MDIILNNEVMRNENLSKEAKGVYIAIKRMSFNYDNTIYTTPKIIEKHLNIKPTRYTTNAIIEGLKELIVNNIVQCNEVNIKATTHIEITGIDITTKRNYTILNADTVNTIRAEGLDTIVGLAVIVSEINCDTTKPYCNLGWRKQETLAINTGVSVNTFSKIRDRLEELKIIYVARVEGVMINNHYCLYEHKDHCNTYVRNFFNNKRILTKERKGETLRKKPEPVKVDIIDRPVAFGEGLKNVVKFVPKSKIVKVDLQKDKKNTVEPTTVDNKFVDLNKLADEIF